MSNNTQNATPSSQLLFPEGARRVVPLVPTTILRWDGRKFHVVSPTVLAPLDYGRVPNYPFPLYGTHSFPVPGPVSYAVPNYGRRE